MALPWTNKILALEAERDALKALIDGTGHYSLAKADDGTLSLAPTEKLTALLALGDVSAELAQANADLRAAADSNIALQRSNDAYAAAFPAGGHFAFADGKVSLTEAGKTAHINAGITQAVAAAGHAPLPIGGTVDSTTATASKDAKDTPHKRLAAAFNAELAGRTNK